MTAAYDRRSIFKLCAAALGLFAAPPSVAASRARGHDESAVFLIPGYRPEVAVARGRPAHQDALLTRAVPRGWDDALTMVTRITESSGEVRRAIFPAAGHQICVHPHRREALLAGMNRPTMVRFGIDDLDMRVLGKVERDGFGGGGHAAYTVDAAALVVSERAPPAPYSGRPPDHYGRIVIRDPDTLAVVDSHSSHGIQPHEIALIENDTYVAVANYGSPQWPADLAGQAGAKQNLPFVVEPNMAIIELATGKLVDRFWPAAPETEIRHLAAGGLNRLFAIQARTAGPGALVGLLDGRDEVVDQDRAAGGAFTHLPAPVLRVNTGEATGRELLAADPLLTRQGQSIVYDPDHDQAIATFTSGHGLMAFDGASGAVIHERRTDRVGLRYPRGIDLHPDGIHYVVSGTWNDLFFFRRDDHSLVRERCIYETFFEHSHLTVA